MLPTRKQWKSWSLPSKYSAIGLFLTVVGLVVTLISPFLGADYVVENIKHNDEKRRVVHALPIDFKLNITKGNIGDDIEGGVILQAREAPILLNKNIEISNFTFDPKYFSLDKVDEKFVSVKIKDVQLNKLSLEKAGETVDFLVTVRPSFLFVRPNYSVWNLESSSGEKVGEITLLLRYSTLNSEKSINVTVPIRLS